MVDIVNILTDAIHKRKLTCIDKNIYNSLAKVTRSATTTYAENNFLTISKSTLEQRWSRSKLVQYIYIAANKKISRVNVTNEIERNRGNESRDHTRTCRGVRWKIEWTYIYIPKKYTSFEGSRLRRVEDNRHGRAKWSLYAPTFCYGALVFCPRKWL